MYPSYQAKGKVGFVSDQLFWSLGSLTSTLNLSAQLYAPICCRAQQSRARLGNRDVAPVAALQNVKCMSRFWPREPPGPHKFGTHDLHLLLGVSKYVSDRVRYFLA